MALFKRNKKKEIDIIIDNSEFYDFELVDTNIDYGVDLVLDNSEFFDLELTDSIIEYNVDMVLDNSSFYDYELTNDDINYDDLTVMTPSCLDCDDLIISLQNEFGFLLNDEYKYLLTRENYFLEYH